MTLSLFEFKKSKMEALLKIFFENFDSMERNCLHARYKRRALVDYFNTLIEGCRLGKNIVVFAKTIANYQSFIHFLNFDKSQTKIDF